MGEHTVASFELSAWGSECVEGTKAGDTLSAYVAAGHATVVRRLLCRRLAMMAAAACLLELFTPLLPGIGLIVTLSLCAAGAIGACVVEQRAHRKLRSLLAGPEPAADAAVNAL